MEAKILGNGQALLKIKEALKLLLLNVTLVDIAVIFMLLKTLMLPL
jgi:hypothetical protein